MSLIRGVTTASATAVGLALLQVGAAVFHGRRAE
jgi:hypothetical protein